MNNNVVITCQYADVNGDGINDKVCLTGYKSEPKAIFIENITIVVEDGQTKNSTTIALPVNDGYDPRLFLGDFNKDKVADIFVAIASGGTGRFGFYYIFSFKNNVITKLFDFQEFNKEFKYDVTYKDNYKVQVYSKKLNKKFIIDVSNRKKVYKDIYGNNGKLLRPVKGYAGGLVGLYPVNEREGSYDLLAQERITGIANADLLGYVETILTWDGTKFIPVDQYVRTVDP